MKIATSCIAFLALLTPNGVSQTPPPATTEAEKAQPTNSSDVVLKVDNGVTAPHLTYAPDPEYSKKARKAKYQGTCVLAVVVGTDGKVRDIRVTKTLGMGLDEKAIEAVQKWKFDPALKDGQPVAAQVTVQVNFKLY